MVILIILGGVSGSGKSFFCAQAAKRFGFICLPWNTTRPQRANAANNGAKVHITHADFEEKIAQNQFLYHFHFPGNNQHYGILRTALEENQNYIIESPLENCMELKTAYESHFPSQKALCVYIRPHDLNGLIEKIKERENSPEQRISEVLRELAAFDNNKSLQKKFAFVILNHYNENSLEEFMKNLSEFQ